jgi:hypothetical protein
MRIDVTKHSSGMTGASTCGSSRGGDDSMYTAWVTEGFGSTLPPYISVLCGIQIMAKPWRIAQNTS